MSICSDAEFDSAVLTLNHAFVSPAHAMTRRCKIALGVNLILTGLAGLDASTQAEVTSWLTDVLHLADPMATIVQAHLAPAAGVPH